MIHHQALHKLFIFLTALVLGIATLTAQEAAPTPKEATSGPEEAPKKVDHYKLVTEKLSQPDPGYDAFMVALEDARKALIPENYLLGVQIYYQLNNNYDKNLPELLQSLRASAPKWNFKTSPYFASNPDELKALEYALLARMAFVVEDMDAFESNLKESFWLGSPHVSVIFIKWLDTLKTQGRPALMAKDEVAEVKFNAVPFDVEIEYTHGGKTTLAELAKGKKAILLDFWAPWCGPCMALMPQLIHKAEVLESQGIVVAAMDTDDRGKAEKIRRDKQIKFPWLMETDSQLYSKLFEINSIPRMILISQDGEVLFNGHPQDKALQKALSGLGVTL